MSHASTRELLPNIRLAPSSQNHAYWLPLSACFKRYVRHKRPIQHIYKDTKGKDIHCTAITGLTTGMGTQSSCYELFHAPYNYQSPHSLITHYFTSLKTKSPCTLPVGKSMPLPILQQPWSHQAIDFIMNFPLSNGLMTIMVMVDFFFSKTCRLVPVKFPGCQRVA